jgi:hypothetical protein
MAAVYSLDVRVDCGTVLLDYIDSGAGTGKIVIRTSAGTLLATVTLNSPGGTVNIITGQLQLDPSGPGTAVANGIAAYAEVTDSDDVVYMTIDAAEGDTAVSGYMVINALSIVIGSSVTVSSATIG